MSKPHAVFLFQTHCLNPAVRKAYEEVAAGAAPFGETVLLFHQQSPEPPVELRDYNAFVFTSSHFKSLGYTPLRNSFIPGSNHFALMAYYLRHPHFDHYWLVEHDVRYNGNWRQFFENFSGVNAGFISSHIHWAYEEPFWNWWFTLRHPKIFIPFQFRLRSFNPIYRISGRALRFIHAALLDNWRGHHELLFPTLLNLGGFTIIDFGGTGKFVLPGFENKHYTSCISKQGELCEGTFRYRPVMPHVGPHINKLYHPVKQ